MVQLTAHLRGRAIGLTISDMMQLTERSRATVERMLAGLIELGLVDDAPKLDGDHHLTKRWRLDEESEAVLKLFTVLEARERSALERLLGTMPPGPAQYGLAKLLSRQRSVGRNLVNDLGDLIEWDAHVDRVGPRQIIDQSLMDVLEPAIAASEIVELRYASAPSGRQRWRRVQALGMLVGRLAHFVGRDARGVKTYRMDLITAARRTPGQAARPGAWNLKNWARESFGVHHGDEVIDVELLFSPRVAARAAGVWFHASQTSQRCADGALIVRLRCCGHRELLHELCHPDWLGEVRIENPPALVEELREYAEKMLSAYNER